MRKLVQSILICFPALLNAQSCLHGTVKDQSTLDPVPFAKIYIPEEEAFALTDGSGNFTVCQLRPGNVTVQIRAFGYKPHMQKLMLADSVVSVHIELEPATTEYPEVLVFADRVSTTEKTPNNVVSLSTNKMRDNGALSLSDGIANIPGVSQLTTGAGISKPVIRGLFGNRIQTMMLGLRFDNQQWQEEHGLGLSDVGIDRIEIIKGPAALLFGSEAMGGVLNIIEEKPAAVGKVSGDLSIRGFSNTFGTASDVGIKGANGKINWRFRAGIDSHADYTDGNGKRILNTRFGGYYAKTTLGFRYKKWLSENNYFFSLNNFGFIMDSSLSILTPDSRQSRSFQMPHHSVCLNALSSQNSIRFKSSMLKLTLGLQANDRQEQEGGSKISLDMLLTSGSLNALWVKEISKQTEWSLGIQQLYQDNLNLGSRMIVPDAHMYESSLFSYLKHEMKKTFLETGIRYTLKNIHTFKTGDLNTGANNPGVDILPFNNWYQSLNGSFGFSYIPDKHWNIKLNGSSGFRAGNLAELSSNGLHEGSLRYEIGNTAMKTEQNICGDLYVSYDRNWISLSASSYINHFFNYIYLAPTDEEYIGFQIYRYVQKDATLTGGESTLEIHPQKVKWLKLSTAYSIVRGETKDREFLPFIPAQKLSSETKFVFRGKRSLQSWYMSIRSDYVFRQGRPGQFETATNAYYLINAGCGATLNWSGKELHLSLFGKNLLNNTYYDHLSRYKYFGIYNMGRNIVINLKYVF